MVLIVFYDNMKSTYVVDNCIVCARQSILDYTLSTLFCWLDMFYVFIRFLQRSLELQCVYICEKLSKLYCLNKKNKQFCWATVLQLYFEFHTIHYWNNKIYKFSMFYLLGFNKRLSVDCSVGTVSLIAMFRIFHQ